MCINSRGNPKSTEYYTAKKIKGPKPDNITPNAIGVCVTQERPDAENTLAGHVPIKLSRLLICYCKRYREEKEGGWSCPTRGKVYSLLARIEEREDFCPEHYSL